MDRKKLLALLLLSEGHGLFVGEFLMPQFEWLIQHEMVNVATVTLTERGWKVLNESEKAARKES